jgi:hypothetical protein
VRGVHPSRVAAWIRKDLRDHPDGKGKPVIPNENLTWEVIMAVVAVLAAISLLGILATIGWVGYVSMGIRREDRCAIHGAPGVLTGAGRGRAARIARHATGAHGI